MKDKYIHPHERRRAKDNENKRVEGMLSIILYKWVHRRRGRLARVDPPFGTTQVQLGACKTRRAQEQLGESPRRPPRTKGKMIVSNVEAIASKGKSNKPSTSGGKEDKEKGKEARGIYASFCRKPILTIPRNPNVLSWARGFYAAVHAFWADSQVAIPSGLGTVDAFEIVPGTDAQISSTTLGTEAPADGATA
uniref:Integrase core domain containing protein n=1 Tax=Solanum tuberosum TaxID=4113 RepID=M1DGG6_SOLTU